jgi:hypothetical protein
MFNVMARRSSLYGKLNSAEKSGWRLPESGTWGSRRLGTSVPPRTLCVAMGAMANKFSTNYEYFLYNTLLILYK